MTTQICPTPALDVRPSATVRVVVCEPDPEIRVRLRCVLVGDPMLTLAAEARNGAECQAALEEVLPELLVIRSELMPALLDSPEECGCVLPVVVNLAGLLPGTIRSQQPADGTEVIRKALDEALQEVYSRKVKQLAYLVGRYVAGSEGKRRYPSLLNVDCDGHSIDLNVDEISAVIARRRQVSIRSTLGHFVLREPIGIVVRKLDPALFIRIHRSIVVNARHLDRARSIRTHAVLEDGARYPVGPNYRETFGELLQSDC
jgi:two-component system LytT family response regulator